MGSLLVGVKRFLQNKNTVTVIALLAAIGIIYFSYNYRIKLRTQPVSVPYAVNEIGPRTLITSDMVSVKKVPGGVVTNDVILSTDNIVGKYVTNTAVVPEGSMFYNSVVITWNEFPESYYADIAEGQTVYNLAVNSESTYGNSIFPGNYIDIYFRVNINENGSKVWVGKFIENAKVLAVNDASSKSVFETNGSPGDPAFLAFAVSDDVRILFEKIKGIGQGITLFPVQRNASYSNSKEEKKMRIVNAEFENFVNSYAVEDSIVKGGN